ncbi:MAG: isocitrate lyase/phosphoenolpyruvate mutase family protein [Candidatus Binatia bacterium]|jgi:2-methylisocitrate lyase-like PEP mutase family enzyme|nr:isocitrate lyase/phosphoenolpyruvate mutase family protein [Candidatus Binatia bacterium]
MVDNAGLIAEVSKLPVIADADTGYGGTVNVRRTVRAPEGAGVAGIYIEDQQWPKRCGFLEGKTLIPVPEMAAKVWGAVDVREDGADVIFIEAP